MDLFGNEMASIATVSKFEFNEILMELYLADITMTIPPLAWFSFTRFLT